MTGFYSKPELQKLNRNSIYIFVNKRLIRDRLVMHAIVEAYRNVIPPSSFPVVLLYLEMPPEEVDVNVHPAKTEVRFRQQGLVHDFVRDSLRMALVKARPAAGFLEAMEAGPKASPSLIPVPESPLPGAATPELPDSDPVTVEGAGPFALTEAEPRPEAQRLPFRAGSGGPFREQRFDAARFEADKFEREAWGEAAAALFNPVAGASSCELIPEGLAEELAGGAKGVEAEQAGSSLSHLASLKPMGQLRESFIVATNEQGLWLVDQHVAHERVLFEKILRDRQVERVERQRLLMPLLVDLKPDRMVVFAGIAEELERNGFEVEPFGPQTLAVKAAPVGLEGRELERMLSEVIEQAGEEGAGGANEDLDAMRARIAASIACHAAIKINPPLDATRMEWLLDELAKTELPTSCPHGRPIALLYGWREILKAFKRI